MINILKESLGLFVRNPVVICSYAIFCYELAQLCRYGRSGNSIDLLVGCLGLLVILFLWEFFSSIKGVEFKGLSFLQSRIWLYSSVSLLVLISAGTGLSVYKSGTNFGGKLAWVLNRMKNEKKVEFVSNHIDEFGLRGIFADINESVELPKVLYLADDFNLTFHADGVITSFDMFVYGKNAENKDASFLIYYDLGRDEFIRVVMNGYVEMDYHEDKLLAPLIETCDEISFREAVSNWNEDEYSVYYEGKRSFPYGTEGVTLLVEDDGSQAADTPVGHLVGYAVSLYVSGKEGSITPMRYVLPRYFGGDEPQADKNQAIEDANKEDLYCATETVCYKFEVLDKALGSTFYGLNQSTDGGTTWNMINPDPFGGVVGDALGIKFINDDTGFIAASRSGGSYSELYQTSNGGAQFEKIEFTPHEVKLENGTMIAPFDFPTLPFEEEGILNVLIGQGTDGDYLGSSQAMYQSRDNGVSWSFVKILDEYK